MSGQDIKVEFAPGDYQLEALAAHLAKGGASLRTWPGVQGLRLALWAMRRGGRYLRATEAATRCADEMELELRQIQDLLGRDFVNERVADVVWWGNAARRSVPQLHRCAKRWNRIAHWLLRLACCAIPGAGPLWREHKGAAA